MEGAGVTTDRSDQTEGQPVAHLDLAGVQVPVFELGGFNAANLDRVKSFATNFGTWQVPDDIARALGVPPGKTAVATLQWIHDTGELVLLGGVPEPGEVEVDVERAQGVADAVIPAWLGGVVGGVQRDPAGGVRERYRAEVMPAGSRVAVLAHIAHGPRAHEVLWGWHRQHRQSGGWRWLLDRLEKLAGKVDDRNHLG
jgi:hypothetical protein